MNDYTINGQSVSERDWNAFKESLVHEIPSAKACFNDNNVTKDEIVRILDTDKNKKLTHEDLKGFNETQFGTLNSILKKHGFSIGTEAEKNSRSVFETSLRNAPKYLFKNRDFMLAVVKVTGWALEYADPSLKRDREIVLAAVKDYGRSLLYADPSLKKDPEIVLAAVKQDGMALENADSSLQRDKKIVLAAVKQNGGAIKFASKTLRDSPSFVHNAAKISVSILDCESIMQTVKDDAWKKILVENNNFKELNILKRSLGSYEEFKKYIKEKYDIEFLGRFRSVGVLTEILKIREKPVDPNDKRPLAVLIRPKNDEQRSFERYAMIDRLVKLGYRVAYYEAKDEAQVELYLSEATNGGKRKADVIILSGHGTSETLALSGEDLAWSGKMENEKNYIDTSDFKGGRIDINLPRYPSPEGDLILDSCSNGAGGKENPKNLANTIARIMPQGVQIQSSKEPMNVRGISKDNGRLKMEWTEDSLYTTKGSDSMENKLLNFLRSYFQ